VLETVNDDITAGAISVEQRLVLAEPRGAVAVNHQPGDREVEP